MFAPPSSCSRRAVVARWAHAGAGTLGFLAPFLAGHARVVSPARSRPGLCLSCVHTLVAVEKRIVPLLKFPITYLSPPQRVPRSSRTPLPALGFLSSHLEQRAPSQARSSVEALFPREGSSREGIPAGSQHRPPAPAPADPAWKPSSRAFVVLTRDHSRPGSRRLPRHPGISAWAFSRPARTSAPVDPVTDSPLVALYTSRCRRFLETREGVARLRSVHV